MSRSAFEVLLGRAPAASAAPAAGTVRGSAGPGAAGKRRGEAGGRQTVLALGQRNLKSECRLCGMLYMPGDPIDSRSHARFHQTYTKGIVCRLKLPPTSIVWQDAAGSRTSVVAVRKDCPALVKKSVEVMELVDRDLGSSPEGQTSDDQIFLYIMDEHVVGCIVSRVIRRARRVLVKSTPTSPPTSDGSCNTSTDSIAPAEEEPKRPKMEADCDIVVCSTDYEPAAIGISKLWVLNRYRRRGIAHRLAECARLHTAYGVPVAAANLAFSPPTPSGHAFAVAYTGRRDFLVYTDEEAS